jgi:tripartite-type tricarboxylate transporter receptor subunit TctC
LVVLNYIGITSLAFKLIGTALVAGIIATSATADISQNCRQALDGRDATILVPNGAGGGYDTYARAVAPVLADQTGLKIRVINKEAGGGLVANSLTVNADPNDLIILIGNLGDLAVAPIAADRDAGMLSVLDVLGILHVEPRVWILADGLDVSDPNLTTLIFAQGSIEDGIVETILVGMALGLKTELVTGYSGSNEFIAAILRREVDATMASLQTGLQRSADIAAHIALIMSDKPAPEAPDVPYLAGQGGLADLRAQGMTDAIKAERQSYAQIATSLTQAARGFMISQNVPQDIRDCLRDGFTQTMTSPALITSLAIQGRPLAPISGAQAKEYADNLLATASQSRPLIEQLLNAQERN